MSFSIDCDESNSEETDSQALYLEALFFKPTSGKIQFLNVVSMCAPSPAPGCLLRRPRSLRGF